MWQEQLSAIQKGEIKTIARTISLVENENPGITALLENLPVNNHTSIIGITGAPGSGKSTLTDGLIAAAVNDGKRIAVICIDPSSPFHLGALLGDRIRMSRWYANPNVYIRSLASRGSLGGLHPHIIAITEILKVAPFDQIIVETVGVGQSEIEIAGLADVTIVVTVPEGGDEVQTMKAGLMEIADLFVVNKSDRPGADNSVKQLRMMLAPAYHNSSYEIPIIKTIANQQGGMDDLVASLKKLEAVARMPKRRSWLLAEKAWQLIARNRMKDLSREALKQEIEKELQMGRFSLYRFVREKG